MRTSFLLLGSALVFAACGEPVEVQPDTQESEAGPAAPVSEPETPAPDAASAAASGGTVTFEDLAGQWRVSGVAVMDAPVQALVPDDPSYMGLMIEADTAALTWLGKAPNAVEEDCRGPVTMPQSGPAANTYRARYMAPLAELGIDAAGLTPHAIECIDGAWGPEAAGGSILFSAGPDTAAMSYYDGAVLKLERAQ